MLSNPLKSSSTSSPKVAQATKKSQAAKSSPAEKEMAQEKDSSLPSAQEVSYLFEPVRDFMQKELYERVRSFMYHLAPKLPQVILLEGADAEMRMVAAHYLALKMNCIFQVEDGKTAPNAASEPCLACKECLGFISHLHRDCFFFDGLEASIKIESVRELLPVLGELPRQAKVRTIIFYEAQFLGEAAANALLKSMEEPRKRTVFILSAPQRERLLPTIVSRAITLTLPWTYTLDRGYEWQNWQSDICMFLQTGQGLFAATASKGAVDKKVAGFILNNVQAALTVYLRSIHDVPKEGLGVFFAKLPLPRLRILDEVLAEASESLLAGVNPVLVIEWFATRFYLLLHH